MSKPICSILSMCSLLVMVFASLPMCLAQEENQAVESEGRRKISFGLRLGAGVSNFSGAYNRERYTLQGEPFPVLRENTRDEDDSEAQLTITEQTQNFALSYQGAFYLDIPISSSVSFTPEIGFSLRSNQEKFANQLENVKDTTALSRQPAVNNLTRSSNIQLGHVVSYMPFTFTVPLGIFVQAGPYLGFRVFQSRVDEIQDHIQETQTTVNFEGNSFKSNAANNVARLVDIYPIVDVGLVVGIGYRFPFNLGITARYERSFVNAISAELPERFRLESSHVQHAATLSVSYTIVSF